MDFVPLLENPTSALFAGPSGSGKSQLVAKLIARRGEVFSEPVPDKIVYVYSEPLDDLFDQIKASETRGGEFITVQGLETLDQIIPANNKTPTIVSFTCIIDCTIKS